MIHPQIVFAFLILQFVAILVLLVWCSRLDCDRYLLQQEVRRREALERLYCDRIRQIESRVAVADEHRKFSSAVASAYRPYMIGKR